MQAVPFIRYGRVSRVGGREGEGYISPDEQDRATAQIAKVNGLPTVPGEFLIDEDYSGGTLERPAFQRGLEMIRAGERAGFIVKRYDRFSRDIMDGLGIVREIENLGGALYTGEGRATLQGPDAMVTLIRAWSAEDERRRRAEDLDESVANAIDRGVHLSAPFGYRKGEDKRLVAHPDEAPAVRTMFQRRAEGHSWPSIAKEMQAAGYRPRPSKRDKTERQAEFTPQRVRQIVMSKTYVGTAWNGKRERRGAHPALVKQPLWDRANRTKGTRTDRVADGHLLTGLARCAGCGYVMVVNVTGKGHRTYTCRSRTQGTGHCAAPANANADHLEKFVTDAFLAAFADAELEPSEDTAELDEAIEWAEMCEARLGAAFKAQINLGDASATELRLVGQEIDSARADLRAAELRVSKERNAVRGADLPHEFGRELWAEAGVKDRRQWLSVAMRAVVVRRSASYREPVADRCVVISAAESPADTSVIEFVRDGRFTPASWND